MTRAKATPDLPYTVAIDTREQRPYAFARDARIRTATVTLSAGDYSLVGFTTAPHGCAIERKSLSDAFGTFGRGRDRFERELARLAVYKFAAVVVEAEWSTILSSPPPRARLHPRSILGSIIAWKVRFPSIQWEFLPGRDVAEAYTARLLDRFWRENNPATTAACPIVPAGMESSNVELPVPRAGAPVPALRGSNGLPDESVDGWGGVPAD